MLIYNLYPNIQLGNFYYDHNLKIYEYINFVTDDHLIEIVDNMDKINNTIMKAQLCGKENINIYNPLKGIIYKIK